MGLASRSIDSGASARCRNRLIVGKAFISGAVFPKGETNARIQELHK
jgi:hypothetical protein